MFVFFVVEVSTKIPPTAIGRSDVTVAKPTVSGPAPVDEKNFVCPPASWKGIEFPLTN
jgi:hypothetical protein